MSRIQKTASSEVFDEYSAVMQKYMLKKQANVMAPMIKALKESGLSSLKTLLSAAGMTLDDFIIKALKSGMITPEEISKLTGKNINEINKLMNAGKEVVELGVKNAPKVSKLAPELINAANIMTEQISVISKIAQGMKLIGDKSVDEVALMMVNLKRSRASMAGQATKAKNALLKASKETSELLNEKLNLEELYKKSIFVLKKSEAMVDTLEKKILDLGGKLDEKGNLIKTLKDDVAKGADNISGLESTIKNLSEEGIKLAAKHKKELAKAIDESRKAGYLEGLAKAAKEAAGENSFAAKATSAAARQASKDTASATKAVTKASPAAAKTVSKATAKASKEGAAKAAKEVAKVTSKPSRPSTATAFIMKLFLKNSPKILGTSATLIKGLTFLAIAGLVSEGAVYAWINWLRSNFQLAEEEIDQLRANQYNAIRKLRELNFKEGSNGLNQTSELIEIILKSFNSLDNLKKEDLSKAEFFDALTDLTTMEAYVDNYLKLQEDIKQDLNAGNGFDEAINALTALSENTLEFKEIMMQAMQYSDELLDEPSDNQKEESRGINQPIARPAENTNQQNTEEPLSNKDNPYPQIVSINNEDIDISRLSRGMRSAAPRIIKKVLNTPEGLAFTDPENKWGGWLTKTQNNQNDYLRSLKYLYLNKIFNRTDLRKFVRQNLDKVGRKRMSGWKNAVKFYRGKLGKYANQKNNNFFTQKFTKPANSNESSVIYDNGINKDMHKKADQISKQYFQDAVAGLEDQYAKSYYAGLKSMYDNKLGKSEADFVKLYKVHNESGADLIGAAHPKTIDIADAMGKGGVVENQIEQHRHNKGVALSMPSGNFRGRHAWVIQNLVKLGDQADDSGLNEASDLIDNALQKLMSI